MDGMVVIVLDNFRFDERQPLNEIKNDIRDCPRHTYRFR
jgi:hypothetical protein